MHRLSRAVAAPRGEAQRCGQMTGYGQAQRFEHAQRGRQAPGVAGRIVAGTPVCARTAWSGGGAHFVTIAGFIEGDLIEVHEPVSGVPNVDYDVFVTSYLGSGSWTHSYFTRS